MPQSRQRAFAGVHVGATNIVAGIFSSDLDPLGCSKLPTKPERGPEAVLDRIVKAITDAAAAAEIKPGGLSAIGAGLPGAIDPQAGEVRLAVNLGWKDVPVAKHLENALGVHVFVDNDANLSLLGIYEQELAREPDLVLGVFIGSGIGGALMSSGSLYRGHRYSAAEIGHMIIDRHGPLCGCGRHGCFEALSSRTAIYRELRAAIEHGQKTVLAELLNDDPSALRSGHLREAVRRGDKLVRTVLNNAAENAGLALSNLVLLYDPQLIVLGGGLMEGVGTVLLPTIQRVCGEMLPKGSLAPPEIVLSALADNAGPVGGAILARSKSHVAK